MAMMTSRVSEQLGRVGRVGTSNLGLSTIRSRAQLVVLIALLGMLFVTAANPVRAANAPLPPSPLITDINWASTSTIQRAATGSDAWAITWGDDGNLYTAFSDGYGFTPKTSQKLSNGYARVEGAGDSFSGFNIRSATGEQTGDGASGKKASGMISVDGRLYMWVRNADNNGHQCQLAWSDDHADTWTWSSWNFTELGYCAFLNFGQDNAGARDGYVYMYTPNTSSAYNETDDVVLTRVAKAQVTDRNAYEFFTGTDGSGNANWSSDIAQRSSVANMSGMANRLDVTYNTGIDRYMMTMRSRGRDGGVNQFSIYDAPEPWGPWTTAYYTESWEGGTLSTSNGGWGESAHIPSKWISADGKDFYLVFAGEDSFSVRKGTLVIPTATVNTVWPTNGWTAASPSEMNMDDALLTQARNFAQTGGGAGLITRGGKVVSSWGNIDQTYDVKSTTKAIGGGTALGLAINDGLVGLNDLAQSHMADIGNPPSSNQWLDQITIEQLATETAGFDKPGGFIDMIYEPGTAWGYTDGGPNWLADLLTTKYGDDLKNVLFNRAYSQLGITSSDLSWRSNGYRGDTIDGIKRREFGAGISANVDAMARIGYLYLRDGMWEDSRVLPAGFAASAGSPGNGVQGLPVVNDTKNRFGGASDHYGLLWWNNADGAMPNVPTDAYWAWGMGDSVVLVIPSLDIVAARAGGEWSGSRDPSYYQIVEDFIDPIARSAGAVAPPPPTPTIDQTPPSVPSGLSANAVSETEIALSWNASGDSESGVSGYNVYRDGTFLDSSSTTSLNNSGLTSNTSYTYEVSAINGDGVEGAKSASVTATTVFDPNQLVITNFSVASGNTNEVVNDGFTSNQVVYSDRTYTFGAVPSGLDGKTFIRTANGDKTASGDSFMTFDVSKNVNVYVGYDTRAAARPNWMSDWTDTGETVSTSDASFGMYMKPFTAGQVALGGNSAAGASGAGSNYTVVVVGNGSSTPPPEPQDPVASFTATPEVGEIPFTVTFDASASFDPDGTITSYDWDFGDGSTQSTTAPVITHDYTVSGTFNVTLTVHDDGLGSGTSSMSIMANEPPPPPQDPVASFTATPEVGEIPFTVTFDASASFDPDGTITSYDWDFGDGSTQSTTAPVITHDYTVSGTFVVTLTVHDDGLGNGTASMSIMANEPPPPPQDPVASFTVTPDSGDAPLPVTFDASASFDPDGSLTGFDWDFGDGTTLYTTTPVVTHDYAVSGSFVVTLTVYDNETGTDSATANVTVNDPPPPPSNPVVSISSGETPEGDTVGLDIVISEAPYGLSGITVDVEMADGSVADFVDANFPMSGLTQFTVISDTVVRITWADISDLVGPGATDVTLATINVQGVSAGSTGVSISQIVQMDDDSGTPITADTAGGTISVTSVEVPMPTIPGQDAPVQDLNGDGLVEDLNGNGLADFDDVVVFFENLDSSVVLDNIGLFDFNGNGVVDMADIVAMFESII